MSRNLDHESRGKTRQDRTRRDSNLGEGSLEWRYQVSVWPAKWMRRINQEPSPPRRWRNWIKSLMMTHYFDRARNLGDCITQSKLDNSVTGNKWLTWTPKTRALKGFVYYDEWAPKTPIHVCVTNRSHSSDPRNVMTPYFTSRALSNRLWSQYW